MADIISPLPGIFYRSPGPGKEPFVNIGDTITVGQAVGIVEIMKQFTEVQSDVAGTVTGFGVETNEMVNPGDVLVTVSES